LVKGSWQRPVGKGQLAKGSWQRAVGKSQFAVFNKKYNSIFNDKSEILNRQPVLPAVAFFDLRSFSEGGSEGWQPAPCNFHPARLTPNSQFV